MGNIIPFVSVNFQRKSHKISIWIIIYTPSSLYGAYTYPYPEFDGWFVNQDKIDMYNIEQFKRKK